MFDGMRKKNAGNVQAVRIKIMNLDLKYLEEKAGRDCKICLGKGWINDTGPEISLGKNVTMTIGEISMPIEDFKFTPLKERICPRCFDPKGRPREGQRVKK